MCDYQRILFPTGHAGSAADSVVPLQSSENMYGSTAMLCSTNASAVHIIFLVVTCPPGAGCGPADLVPAEQVTFCHCKLLPW